MVCSLSQCILSSFQILEQCRWPFVGLSKFWLLIENLYLLSGGLLMISLNQHKMRNHALFFETWRSKYIELNCPLLDCALFSSTVSSFADKTVLLDATREYLDRGLKTIRRNYEVSVKRGRYSQAQVDKFLSLIHPTLEYSDLGKVSVFISLIIGATQIFPNMREAGVCVWSSHFGWPRNSKQWVCGRAESSCW